MNTFKWLLRREFWEHKGGFLWMPIIVGTIMTAFIAVSLLIAVLGVKDGMQINGVAVSSLANVMGAEQKAEFAARIVHGYAGLSMPILMALSICILFFCLGSLYDERKDRSVLFWKSLPVSDSATVLSKVAMALVVAPVMAVVIASITAILCGLLICIAAAAAGVNIFAEVLTNTDAYLAPLQMTALLPVYALWALPTIGWLLMVSAWSRSKPFLWAIGVPLLTGTLLSWINGMFRFEWNVGWFWKNIVGRLLGSVLPGSWLGQGGRSLPDEDTMRSASAMSDMLTQSWQLLLSPNIWIGIVVGSAMIYAAIRLRRWRDEG
jgi:ABC-2 type transport system permease protein